MHSLRRSAAVILGALILTFLGVACSSSSPKASTCDDLQTLATQVRDLPQATFTSNGVADLQKQLDAIGATLEKLKASGSEQFGADVKALQAGLSSLGDTISGVGSGATSLSGITGKVKSDLSTISDAWQKLATDAKDEFGACDLSGKSG